ncbi:MAG TPA: translocation/assembly module TamB domain-containing protein [Saccharospirillum sp.]|nr:translocation/assembly module TamB domain-containing protein [Saccharospirillum sp.]
MAIRVRTVARRAWLIALSLVAGLFLILAVALAFLLGTETGRLTLLAQAERWLPVFTGQTLTIDNPRWATLSELSFDQLTYQAGDGGLSVGVDAGVLEWQPRYIWQRRVWIDSLTADRVFVHVPPGSETEPAPEPGTSTDPLGQLQAVWNRIPPIQLAQLSVARFELNLPDRPVLQARVEADAEINWGSWPARLSLLLTGGENQSVSASVTVDAVDSLSLRGELNAAAEGSWARWVNWPLNEPLVGEWDLRLSRVASQWRADIGTLALPWREHRVTLGGQVSYSPAETRVYLSPLTATIDGQNARFNGYVGPRQADLSIDADALPLALLNDVIPVSDVSGAVSVNGRLSGGWQQPQYDGTVQLDGTLRGDPLSISAQSLATASGVELESAQLNWGEAHVETRGRVQWDTRELDLSLSWQNLDQSRWQPWIAAWPEALALTTTGEGSLTGTFDSPEFSGQIETSGAYQEAPFDLSTDLTATREQLTLSNTMLATEAGDIEASGQLQLATLQLEATTELFDVRSSWLAIAGVDLPVQQNWGVSGQLQWSGTATDPVATGSLAIDGQWQNQPLNASLKVGRFDLTQVQLGQSQVQLADTETELSGTINWQAQTLDLDARLNALRLATIRPFLPALPNLLADLSGNTTGDVQVTGPWLEPAVDASLVFDGRWLDQPLRLEAQVTAENRERWQVSQARLNWSELALTFSGEVQPFARRIDGEYQVTDLTVSDVRRLPLTLPEPLGSLSGRARAQGRIEGDLTAPRVTADLNFEGEFESTPLTLTASLAELTPRQLTLESLALQSDDSRLTASGVVELQPLNFDLDTELTRLSWAQIKPWLPDADDLELDTLSGQTSAQVSVEGSWPDLAVEGQIQSSGQYLGDDYELDWQGSGSLNDRLMHEAQVIWGEAQLQLDLENQGEQITGDAQLSRVSLQRLRALGVPVHENLNGEISGQASIAGVLTDPVVDIELNAGGEWTGIVLNSSGTDRWTMALVGSGQLDDWQITEARADFGPGGEIHLSGQGTRRSVDLQAELTIPETQRWLGNDSNWAGSVEGTVQVSGTPDEPVVAADMAWESSRWPLILDLGVSTANNEHRVQATLKEAQTERLQLTLTTVQTALAGWSEPLSERPFSANAELAVDATVLKPLLRNRPDQNFSGNINGQLSMTGTLKRPEWEGRLNLTEGRYENAMSGAVLADMSAELTANNRTLQVSMNASDTNGGDVSLSGDVIWPEGREVWWTPELDLAFTADEARLIRRADVDATIDGTITVIGPWRSLLVKGVLDVSPLIIQLDSLLQSGAPTLNVVRATEEDEAGAESKQASAFAPAGQWQVRLRAERRAQIYGQGLAAELSGELDITDELSNPQIGGRFQVIRGTYTAFGKNFTIERGNIQVQGSQLLLDIVAVYDGPDITVNLNIQGTQSQLDLSLTSTPALSNDELLARLLFGRSIAEMSALQAVQLATALNSLRNPGSGLDVFGTTRDLLGLDALTLDSATNEEGESGVNIQAGKYLSDRIYLEVESGVGAERGLEGSLQFQLTPRINAELYTRGQFGSGGVELNWKNDY